MSAESLMSTERLARLGKYRLIAAIGQGGMAEVYLAVMAGPGSFTKLVALKVLRSQFSEDPEGQAMFLDEARLAARLNHPNVVQTYEIGEADGQLFIAMEYLEGQPYSRVLNRSRGAADKKGPMAVEMLLRILAETLAGLHHAHELRDHDGSALDLVHRDISPHNVFVTYDGTIKVLDFGIAKAAGGSSHTRTGVLKGKVGYMAPEQIVDTKVDRRADLYAVGVMLWESLAGRRLWKGLSDVAILTRVGQEEVPSVRTVLPTVPAELERICSKACARDRDHRYATAAAMQADLEAYLDASNVRALARDVGKLVAVRFGDVRAETKLRIDQQLVKLREAGSEEVIEQVMLPNVTGSQVSMRGLSSGISGITSSMTPSSPLFSSTGSPSFLSPSSSSGSVSQPGAALLSAPAPTKPRASVAWFAVSAIALVAMGAGLLVYSRREPSPAAANASASVVAAGPAVPAASSASPMADAPVPRIHITFTSDPATATLFLDNERLPSNPTVRDVPNDSSEHALDAVLAGYDTDTEKFVYNADRTIVVRLKKTPVPVTAGRAAGPSQRANADARRGGATTATVTPTAATPVTTATATSTATSRSPKIDTDNPFEKPK